MRSERWEHADDPVNRRLRRPHDAEDAETEPRRRERRLSYRADLGRLIDRELRAEQEEAMQVERVLDDVVRTLHESGMVLDGVDLDRKEQLRAALHECIAEGFAPVAVIGNGMNRVAVLGRHDRALRVAKFSIRADGRQDNRSEFVKWNQVQGTPDAAYFAAVFPEVGSEWSWIMQETLHGAAVFPNAEEIQEPPLPAWVTAVAPGALLNAIVRFNIQDPQGGRMADGSWKLYDYAW